ncbi:MAG: flagellar export protein FliJ [Desulfosarcina sp.]|nr:flagellar export protein FliJ [Desulfosarcina sp.]MBC2742088.1 flagellar export protein FliJ [Desulfosarcina sp.]MBC2765001.1 flagellar export protein FliJ [Desulfosarcina sp.]
MYTFKLQAVLDHRQFIEDNLKKELAEIRQQETAVQQQLDSLTGKEMNTFAALKQKQANGLSSDQVVVYHAYLKRLSERITSQQTVVIEIKEQAAEKEDELLEAMKKRQILERLKDQGLDRYNQVMLKKEMNFIDEIAVNQFARKTIEQSGDSE